MSTFFMIALRIVRFPFVIALVTSIAWGIHETIPTSLRNERAGVATHFGNGGHFIQAWPVERAIRAAVDLGVGWIRDDFYWTEYEKKKGRYELPLRTREWIDCAHAAGLKIILIFNSGIKGNPVYEDSFDPDAYARAAAHLAKELAEKVQVIEVLNEPNNFGFMKHYGGAWNGWDGKGNESPWISQYVKLINKAAIAIKQASPSTKVIGLGAPAPANYRMLAHGIVSEVDGIVDHPYSFRTVPELIPFASSKGMMTRDGVATADKQGTFASQIRMYREYSASHNGPREIWLTEWGFPTHQEAPGKPGMMYAGRTEEAQAKYSLRRLAETFGLGVEMSVIYDLKDDGNDPRSAEDRFGLMDYNFVPKPSFHAVQRMLRFMIPWQTATQPPEVNVFVFDSRPDQWPITWDGSRLAAPGTVITYAFENNAAKPNTGAFMVLFWSAERAGGDLQPRLGDVEVAWPASRPPPSSVRRYDLWADKSEMVQFEQKPGRIWFPHITIPDSPVALIFD